MITLLHPVYPVKKIVLRACSGIGFEPKARIPICRDQARQNLQSYAGDPASRFKRDNAD